MLKNNKFQDDRARIANAIFNKHYESKRQNKRCPNIKDECPYCLYEEYKTCCFRMDNICTHSDYYGYECFGDKCLSRMDETEKMQYKLSKKEIEKWQKRNKLKQRKI